MQNANVRKLATFAEPVHARRADAEMLRDLANREQRAAPVAGLVTTG